MTMPAASEKRDQFVPNWNGMTIPVTTPMPNETAKMRVQKPKIRNQISRPVKKCSLSSTAMNEARPTVKAGSKMCQPMIQAHCKQDRNNGSRFTNASQIYVATSCWQPQ